MNSKERVYRALRKEKIDRIPRDLWVDSGDPFVLQNMLEKWDAKDYAELLDRFDIDLFRPKTPVKKEYLDTEDMMIKYFIPTTDKKLMTSGGGFARPLDHVETAEDVMKANWPSPDIFDYEGIVALCEKQAHRFIWAQPGLWSPIFAKICDLCSMEKCMIDMLCNEEVIFALVDKLFEFYYEVFKRTMEAGKGYIDAISFGDDYASQRGMMFNTDLWHKYYKEPVKKFCELIKSYGLLIGFHSCGAMEPLIPELIKMDVDFIFPVQPRAAGMDLAVLKEKYGEKLGFYGAIDVQQLMPYGTPEQVKEEVKRVTGILGDGGGYILSTAHSITRDIPLENVLAFYEAANTVTY